MKDFWDVRFLIKEFDFDGALLQKAIRATFAARQTSVPQTFPTALTDAFRRKTFDRRQLDGVHQAQQDYIGHRLFSRFGKSARIFRAAHRSGSPKC